MYTSHGHHIPGTSTEPKPLIISRCGGPGLCAPCSKETAQKLTEMIKAQDSPTIDQSMTDYSAQDAAATKAIFDEAAESHLVSHARYELNLIGEDQDTIDWYLRVVAAFASYGHSGGSAMVTIPILNDLLQYKALTSLTNNPAEWNHVAEEVWGEAGGIWQSRRQSDAFSDDGGKTYWCLNEGAHAQNRFPIHTSKPHIPDAETTTSVPGR